MLVSVRWIKLQNTLTFCWDGDGCVNTGGDRLLSAFSKCIFGLSSVFLDSEIEKFSNNCLDILESIWYFYCCFLRID